MVKPARSGLISIVPGDTVDSDWLSDVFLLDSQHDSASVAFTIGNDHGTTISDLRVSLSGETAAEEWGAKDRRPALLVHPEVSAAKEDYGITFRVSFSVRLNACYAKQIIVTGY
jgi:hypothetical protein